VFRIRITLVAFAMFIGACGSVSGACPSSLGVRVPPNEADAVPIHWLALGEGVEVPVINGWIAGKGVRLLLDTGANMSAIERGAAWWSGLSVPPAADRVSGGDALGGGFDALITAYELRVGLHRPFTTPFAVIEWESLLSIGLGGVLSPQLASPAGAAIELDFRTSVVRALDSTQAARVFGPPPGWQTLHPLCAVEGGGTLFSIRVEVQGTSVEMILDSGSTHTSVPLNSPLGASLAARSTGRAETSSITGRVQERVVDGVSIALAGHHQLLDLRVVEPRPNCLEGAVLGLDVLRNCRVVVTRDRGAIRCGP